MAYFQVDNGTSTLTNHHNFFYWEGMNKIQECWCAAYNKNRCTRYECNPLILNSVQGFNLTIWKNTTFISQKFTNYNYYTLIKHAKPPNEQCDEGYKQCGLLDLLNQTLCLLENETCPLNQIEISTSS